MKLTCSLPLVLFLLLVISQGVFSNPPSGNCCMSVAFHSQMSICAVSGSSVVISCSFNNQTCNFIFEIENPNKTMEGKFEINLTVTDLTVLVPLPVIEGGDAKLLCMSVCNVTGDPKVIWRKNGQVVTGKQRNRHELELQNVSIKDEGFYSCGTASASVKLNVMFSPKNTSALFSSDMTLTCSSVANPVANYTWFKVNESESVGSGQQYSITKMSEDEEQYYCEAKNKYGAENSTAVSVIRSELSFGTCLTIGVSVSAAGVLVLVCVVNWISVKKRSGGHKKRDNGHLFTLQPQAPRESGRESDVQYTTVQFKRRESPETEGDDVQCASVQFKMAGVAQGSPDLPEGELSVIYSSVARNGSPTKPSSFPGE